MRCGADKAILVGRAPTTARLSTPPAGSCLASTLQPKSEAPRYFAHVKVCMQRVDAKAVHVALCTAFAPEFVSCMASMLQLS